MADVNRNHMEYIRMSRPRQCNYALGLFGNVIIRVADGMQPGLQPLSLHAAHPAKRRGMHHVPAYASANASAHVSTHRSVKKIPHCGTRPGKHRAKAFLSRVFCERRSAGNAGHRCLICRRHIVAAHQQHAMTRDASTDHVICTAIHRASRVGRCGLSGTSPTAGQRYRIVARSPHVGSDCIRHRQPPFFHQPRESRGPIRC